MGYTKITNVIQNYFEVIFAINYKKRKNIKKNIIAIFEYMFQEGFHLRYSQN